LFQTVFLDSEKTVCDSIPALTSRPGGSIVPLEREHPQDLGYPGESGQQNPRLPVREARFQTQDSRLLMVRAALELQRKVCAWRGSVEAERCLTLTIPATRDGTRFRHAVFERSFFADPFVSRFCCHSPTRVDEEIRGFDPDSD
jgi:hypothetical protein